MGTVIGRKGDAMYVKRLQLVSQYRKEIETTVFLKYCGQKEPFKRMIYVISVTGSSCKFCTGPPVSTFPTVSIRRHKNERNIGHKD